MGKEEGRDSWTSENHIQWIGTHPHPPNTIIHVGEMCAVFLSRVSQVSLLTVIIIIINIDIVRLNGRKKILSKGREVTFQERWMSWVSEWASERVPFSAVPTSSSSSVPRAIPDPIHIRIHIHLSILLPLHLYANIISLLLLSSPFL